MALPLQFLGMMDGSLVKLHFTPRLLLGLLIFSTSVATSRSEAAKSCSAVFSTVGLPSDLGNFIASSEEIARYRSRYEPTQPQYESDLWPRDWSEVQIGRGYPPRVAREHMTYEEYRALNEYTKVGEKKQYTINKIENRSQSANSPIIYLEEVP